jgi:mannose-6-phosphate isomerase-like protein (cupin superfamily)
MPSAGSSASGSATVTAPDGIAIHTFAVPAAQLVGIAEGRLPPGRYAVHRHLTLEQYTYVIEGRVTAITGNEQHPTGQALELEAGSLLLTLPGESLQFQNSSDSVARVLFICAPPYPPDDSDTHLLSEHGTPSDEEVSMAIERLQILRANLNAEIDARLAALNRRGTGPSPEVRS